MATAHEIIRTIFLATLPKGLGLACLIKLEYVRCRTDSTGSWAQSFPIHTGKLISDQLRQLHDLPGYGYGNLG